MPVPPGSWRSPRRTRAGRMSRGSEDVVGVLLVLVLLLLVGLVAQSVHVLDLEYLGHGVRIARTSGQAAVAVDLNRTDAGRHRQDRGRLVLQRRAHIGHPDR